MRRKSTGNGGRQSSKTSVCICNETVLFKRALSFLKKSYSEKREIWREMEVSCEGKMNIVEHEPKSSIVTGPRRQGVESGLAFLLFVTVLLEEDDEEFSSRSLFSTLSPSLSSF
jgi:hypothetical protein